MQHLGCPLAGPALRIARLQAACGEIEAAAETLSGHLHAHPNDTDALRAAAELELQRGDPQAALGMFARSVEIDPDRADVHLRMSRLWLEHGRPRRALR